jgi:hypothetical protein
MYLRGFAAKVSSKGLDSMSAMAAEYPPLIEEDQIISIQNWDSDVDNE